MSNKEHRPELQKLFLEMMLQGSRVYDISKTTITKVLDHLKDFYSTLEDAKLNYCTFNCPKI
jgi:hypothetical protein